MLKPQNSETPLDPWREKLAPRSGGAPGAGGAEERSATLLRPRRNPAATPPQPRAPSHAPAPAPPRARHAADPGGRRAGVGRRCPPESRDRAPAPSSACLSRRRPLRPDLRGPRDPAASTGGPHGGQNPQGETTRNARARGARADSAAVTLTTRRHPLQANRLRKVSKATSKVLKKVKLFVAARDLRGAALGN